MSTSTISPSSIAPSAGGSFLIESRVPAEIFTPEDLTEEQRQIAATAERFARQEILTAADDIEHKKPGVLQDLMRKTAELGFASIDIPEEYGGMGMDKTTSALVADHLAVLASFSTTFGAHAGIATLPLVWYGTDDQKRRYLPKLASCEWIGAYALSEATSGSDAMNIRTRAELTPDGSHYVLNGEKHWISNGGIAGLFTVFAKIYGPGNEIGQFSAFLVERTSPGLSLGAEEHKLGIRGSSTCPLILQDCKVPAANLLGEPGKGHHIAFNVLNWGRLKLGVACVGGARQALGYMIRYANERRAFGRSIAEFGIIQRKIATCTARLYAAESMAYRIVGMIDACNAADHGSSADEKGPHPYIPKWVDEYAVECSVLKIYGSEMMNHIADELVAVMGGYGYVEEYPAERAYRDARINRIFEGTNEINRLIVTGWLMKRAQRGQLPLMAAIKKVMDAATDAPSFDFSSESTGPLAVETQVVTALKKIALFAAGVVGQRFATGLEDQQEVMADLADMVVEVFAVESALLRAQKMAGSGSADFAAAVAGLLAQDSLAQVEQAARRVVAACADGDMLRTQLAILRRLSRHSPANTVALGRTVAQRCVQAEKYPL